MTSPPRSTTLLSRLATCRRPAAASRHRRFRRTRAQVIVEVAVVLPLLLGVALALLQFALYEHAENVIVAAAEDGARVAAAHSASAKDGEVRAKQVVVAGLGRYAQGPNAVATFLPAGANPPDRVEVKVTAKLPAIVPIPIGDGTLPLSATASMSKEHFRGP